MLEAGLRSTRSAPIIFARAEVRTEGVAVPHPPTCSAQQRKQLQNKRGAALNFYTLLEAGFSLFHRPHYSSAVCGALGLRMVQEHPIFSAPALYLRSLDRPSIARSDRGRGAPFSNDCGDAAQPSTIIQGRPPRPRKADGVRRPGHRTWGYA